MPKQFVVPGRPVPYKRMTQRSKYTSRSAQNYLNYKQFLGIHARNQGVINKGYNKVHVEVFLYGKNTLFGMDGDTDNYLKTALDGLNHIAFDDDRQVMAVYAEKHSALKKENERMVVTLYEMDECMSVEVKIGD